MSIKFKYIWRDWRSRLLMVVILVLTIANTIVLFSHQPVKAQSSSITNTELIMLRNRVSRLENQINRITRVNRNQFEPTPSSPPPATTETPPVVDGEAIGRSSPMYERLATLVIELKEDIRDLQQRVNQLEAQIE